MSGEKNTKSKKTSKAEKVFNICIVAALCAAIVFGLVMAVVNAVKPKTTETAQNETAELERPDFSEGLTQEGFIDGIEDESKYVEFRFDINEPIEVPASTVYVDDDEIDSKADTLVKQYGEDGDEFNDDFVKERLGSSLTAEEYREKIKTDLAADKKAAYVEDYIINGYYTLDVPDTYIDV